MTEGHLLLYFCGSTFLAFLIATTVLAFFSKDKTSRLAGYFAIKPIVVYLVSFWTWYYYPWWSHTLDWTPWFVAHFIVEFFLLLTIVYWFRDLYTASSRFPWLFVGLDFLRWGSMLFLFSDLGLLNNAYVAYFILFCFPVLYAILALIFSLAQRRKLQVVRSSA